MAEIHINTGLVWLSLGSRVYIFNVVYIVERESFCQKTNDATTPCACHISIE